MMNIGWVLTGIILLGAMTACAVSLYLKRRRAPKLPLSSDDLRI